jgi:hypothetical protein
VRIESADLPQSSADDSSQFARCTGDGANQPECPAALLHKVAEDDVRRFLRFWGSMVVAMLVMLAFSGATYLFQTAVSRWTGSATVGFGLNLLLISVAVAALMTWDRGMRWLGDYLTKA